jgi:hypothetical protein
MVPTQVVPVSTIARVSAVISCIETFGAQAVMHDDVDVGIAPATISPMIFAERVRGIGRLKLARTRLGSTGGGWPR